MRFYEFANQPIQPALAQPVKAPTPQNSSSKAKSIAATKN